MKKVLKGLLVAGAVLVVGSAGMVAASANVEGAHYSTNATTNDKINGLIAEKMEIIQRKKVSRDSAEQRALGIRIGEIEREISALKRGEHHNQPERPANDTEEAIQNLIAEKMDLIARKKVSRDSAEQRAIGIRIGEIEREISELRRGQDNTGGNSNHHNNNENSNHNNNQAAIAEKEAQIQALIAEKMQVVERKKVSRDKKEQKALGKEIKAIEKEIKQLNKDIKKLHKN